MELNRKDTKIAKNTDVSEEVNALSHEVIGAAIEVHRILGPGYLESVYEESLAVELALRGIPFERQYPINVEYKGCGVGQARVDLLVARKLIVELKAVDCLNAVHKAQALSYLKATGLELAILINFNVVLLRDGITCVALTSKMQDLL